MSKYTTELRYVIEQELDNLNLPHNPSNWKYTYEKIGLADYPLFEEGYRETLNTKIIRHYYTREIGAETIGRFKMFVQDAMYLVMPFYNQMYESEKLNAGLDPLKDREINNSEHAWGNASNDATSHGEGLSDSQNVFNDTPSSEMIPAQIKNMEYATTVNLDTDKTNSDNTSHSSGNYDNMVDRKESGYTRSKSELLNLYRKTFLNIDRDVVEDSELAQCFMTIW